jgi:hypothetical protein
VQVERFPRGVRFVDPPISEGWLRRRFLIRSALQIGLAAAVVLPLLVFWRAFGVVWLVIGCAAAALNLWLSLGRWWQATRHPTVIDVAAGVMVLTLPTRRRMVIPLGDLSDVCAAPPRHLLGVRPRVSSVLVSAFGRRVRLLPYRDYLEMLWLARELRAAVGHEKDHPGEPAPGATPDRPEAGESAPAWRGPLPAFPDPAERLRHPPHRGLRRFLDEEYNRLGCGAFLVLLLLVISGIMICEHEITVLAICLQFGADAYFLHGLRTVPHKGLLLNNGQTIAPQYRAMIYLSIYIVGPFCAGVALLIAIGVNRLLILISEPWHRARQARKNKQDALRRRIPIADPSSPASAGCTRPARRPPLR